MSIAARHDGAVLAGWDARSLVRHPWFPALVAVTLGIAGVLGAHAPTVIEIGGTWASSTTYQYGWAVLPTLGCVLWCSRRRLAATSPAANLIGVAAATLAALLWLAADVLNVSEGRQVALVGSVAAIVMAAVGWQVFRRLLPFLALLAFVIPTGEFLLLPLRRLTVAFIEGFAYVSGLPFAREGFSLYFDGQRYVVVDACAGLPFVLVGLFLGLTFALLLYRSEGRIIALTLAGGVLGILANAIRVVAIVATDYVHGTQLELTHSYFQWAALAATILLLMALVAVLKPERSAETPQRLRRGLGRGRPQVVVYALLAAALPAMAPYVLDDQPPVAEATASALLPANLAGWQRYPHDTDWAPTAHGAASSTLASYSGPLGVIDVFLATATGRRDKVTGGSINLTGDGAWIPATNQALKACTDNECFHVRHTKVLLRESKRVRHLYVALALGVDVVPSPAELRLGRAWSQVRGNQLPARLLAVSSEAPAGLPPSDVVAVLKAVADG